MKFGATSNLTPDPPRARWLFLPNLRRLGVIISNPMFDILDVFPFARGKSSIVEEIFDTIVSH